MIRQQDHVIPGRWQILDLVCSMADLVVLPSGLKLHLVAFYPGSVLCWFRMLLFRILAGWALGLRRWIE